jgi:hypothetical protein
VTVSTLTVAPETGFPAASGAAPCAEPVDTQPAEYATVYRLPASRMPMPHSASSAEHAFYRAATDPDIFSWLQHIRPAAGCTQPIRLIGKVAVVDTTTGLVMSSVDTADMPDGVIYKPCGNRRATVCPSCASTYQRDAYQLVRAGLVGGKGVPTSVAKHHAVFPTLTAPSFGVVHTQRTSKTGQQLRCRPRRHPQLCPHGVDLRCDRIHTDDEKILGQPLCLDCYDHAGQVVWNNQAPELWRRTTIAVTRAIRRRAKALGIPSKLVRLSFGKVAEMQRRGVVHYHAIIRLDGVNPLDPDQLVPPPPGLTVQDLVDAVEAAVPATRFVTDPHPAQPGGWSIEWGRQLHCPPVRVTGDGAITDGMVAGYLAKYATKSTEVTGHHSRRLTSETIDLHADPDGSHVERLVDACWTLGQPPAWRGLRRWAHMLGFGGHFLTKSRRYSVTFKILRDRRVIWRRTETGHLAAVAAQHDQETTAVVGLLNYSGTGWHTTGDALLANTSAALARARHQAARDAITDEINNHTHLIASPLAA